MYIRWILSILITSKQVFVRWHLLKTVTKTGYGQNTRELHLPFHIADDISFYARLDLDSFQCFFDLRLRRQRRNGRY